MTPFQDSWLRLCSRLRWPVGTLALCFVYATPAEAYKPGPLTGTVWKMWDASPVIVGGCVLVLWIYGRGFWRRRRRGESTSLWRAVSFSIGVLLTYIILQSPVDALSDHIFWIHRVQHVALHHWIPMLLALAAPIPELLRGLPAWGRRYLLKPVLRNRGVRAAYAFIQHPVVAPLLFVGLIYFWLTPSLFQAATVNETLHKIMHFSMLIDGIPFWWLMLDPKPGRVAYLKRVVILWAIMLPQMLVGAYITFTSRVLYPLYATLDQGWVSSYLVDQHLGGLVVWIPASMMSVVAMLIVFGQWMRWEHRVTIGREGRPPAQTTPEVEMTVR